MRVDRPCITCAVVLGIQILFSAGAVAAEAPPAAAARVVVLGVSHSNQLVAKGDQPAMLEAFIDRVHPDAICIERAPQPYSRNDFYEFTYEQQGVVVPYARRHHIALYPIDWEPSREDELLGWGIDLDTPPELRPDTGFQAFTTFTRSDLGRKLYDSDNPATLADVVKWETHTPDKLSRDMPRRLFLYRTFMQARRIEAVADAHPGQTVLVVVGYFHKHDIEAILRDDKAVRLVKASSFGLPTPQEIRQHDRPEYQYAIATFNLLGKQFSTGVVDTPWVSTIVADLSAKHPDSPEVRLLATRLALLTHAISPAQAIDRYRAILADSKDMPFTWTGVQDASRVDSYFDPFGNLTVHQRTQVELARLLYQTHDTAAADALLPKIQARLTPRKAAQLAGYWRRELTHYGKNAVSPQAMRGCCACGTRRDPGKAAGKRPMTCFRTAPG